VAEAAWATAAKALNVADISVEIVIFDRKGGLVASTPLRQAHRSPS
jgi:hypothetical protein